MNWAASQILFDPPFSMRGSWRSEVDPGATDPADEYLDPDVVDVPDLLAEARLDAIEVDDDDDDPDGEYE